ncbi:MAG: amidohydrolase family protein [Bacteroidota bacterium]|nr:amidohydrolase family protein [Bacteroidota bacterium]
MAVRKIDAHQHFWKYNQTEYEWIGEDQHVLKRDFLPDDLIKELDKITYTGSIAVQARQSLDETRWLLKIAEQYDQILGVVGWLDLQSRDVDKQLDEFAGNQWLKGVRHVLHDEPDNKYMLKPAFVNGISMLAENNLVYEILIFPRHLASAIELVSLFPKQQFVLDHIAKPDIRNGNISEWKKGMEHISRFTNVSVKVSGMVTEADHKNWKPADFKPYLELILKTFGDDRILLGSDWPVCLLAASYSQVMCLAEGFFEKASQKAMAKIQGGNAARIYRL